MKCPSCPGPGKGGFVFIVVQRGGTEGVGEIEKVSVVMSVFCGHIVVSWSYSALPPPSSWLEKVIWDRNGACHNINVLNELSSLVCVQDQPHVPGPTELKRIPYTE